MPARRVLAGVVGLLLVAPLAVPVAAAPARDIIDACSQIPDDAFPDVAPGTAHENAVDCIVYWGIARGVTREAYAPERGIQRDQMATFLANVITSTGGALPEASRDHFTDDDGSVHEDSINRLAEAGVVAGRAGGRYEPAAAVSRGQMTTFLVTAYDERAEQAGEPPLAPAQDAYSDDDGTTHEQSIDTAAAAGLAAGTGDGRFEPGLPVRRDQMGSFVARTLSLIVDNGITGRPDHRPGDLATGFGDWDHGTSADDHDGYAQMDVEGGYDVATAAQAGGGGDERRLAGETSVPVDGDPGRRARVWTIVTYRSDGSYQDGWATHGRLVGAPGDPFRILSLGYVGDGVLAGGFNDCGPGCTAGVVARFFRDGTTDVGWGDRGRVTLPGKGAVRWLATDTYEQSGPVDQRVYVGTQVGSGDAADFAITRLLMDGRVDETFGDRGTVTTDLRGGSDDLTSMAVLPHAEREWGALVVGGTSSGPAGSDPSSRRFALAKYRSDGSLDPTFGTAGTVETDVSSEPGSFESLKAIAFGGTDRIVAVGDARPDGVTPHLVVVRYSRDGVLDTSFGTGGVFRYRGAAASAATAVGMFRRTFGYSDDDRVYVAGRAADNPVRPQPGGAPGLLDGATDWTFAVLVLRPDGTLDPGFGDAGIVRTPVGRTAAGMILQRHAVDVIGCQCRGPVTGPDGRETPSDMVVAVHSFHSGPRSTYDMSP